MMPALFRAYGAALTTSRALPTPGRGRWPLHPRTICYITDKYIGDQGAKWVRCWPNSRGPRISPFTHLTSAGALCWVQTGRCAGIAAPKPTPSD